MICQLFNPQLIPLSKETIKEVRERDKVCRKCFAKENLDVHHIVSRVKGGSNNPTNLVLLCGRCHRHMEIKTWKYGLTRFEKSLIEENKNVQSMLELQ
jgi:5-methylcytosine-specific restriction endonuclease McrA